MRVLGKFIFLIIFLYVPANSKTLKNVTLDDKIQIDKKDLVLNGMGLRTKSVFGLPIKVYIGGLYLEKVSQDSEEILKSPGLKQIQMEYLRAVEREKLTSAFMAGYEANCLVDCENYRTQLKPFLAKIPFAAEKSRWIISFYPEKVIFEITGADATRAEFPGAAISKNLLSVFINKKAPPTEEFRKGLLGL
jgi:hypothetical protein